MAAQNTKFLVQAQGKPLQAVAHPIPTIDSPTEVLIRLQAIAINPADVKMIDQGHRISAWPLVAGLDGAGVVEAVGRGVQNVGVGDAVLATFAAGDRGGSFQEFAVVDAGSVARRPGDWSAEQAASLGVCFFTAVVGLGIGLQTPLPFLKDGPTAGLRLSSVLVLGGSSALGAATIQLLRLALPDCQVFTTAAQKHHGNLATLGAHRAFDRASTSLVADVKAASPSLRGVDAIFDAVGAGATERYIFDTLSTNGPKRYAQVWTGDDEIEVPAGVDSVLFRSRDVMRLEGGKYILLALQTLLAERKYKLPLPVKNVGRGLEGLKKGLDMMREGVSGEKLVVGI